MRNETLRTSKASARSFLIQESVFLGFNDYMDGIWGEDYETKSDYWQVSYEWGRQIAGFVQAKGIDVVWDKMDRIPRKLTHATLRANRDRYILNS
jgi:hypothetical protein